MASLLLIAGGIIALVGWIMFLIVAFKESILWGIGCLIFAVVGLVFLVLHWNDAKKPFFIWLAGGAILFVARTLGGG